MAVNPDKNIVEQSLIARLIGKIKRIALDISDDVSAEETRAMAAEVAAKTVVTAGENCSVTKTTASDGHDVYTINADGKPQVQADWNQADSSKVDYIKNKLTLSNAIDSTSTTEAATPKAVKDAYDELNNKIVARAVFLSQKEWSAQSLLPGDPAKVYYVENGTGEDAYTVYVWKASTSEYVEVDESSIDLDGYWHDGPSSSGTGNVVTGMSLGNDGVPVLEKNLTAATLDSNGTVPVSQIPDAIKDKIVFIDGTITSSGGSYSVSCNTTYAQVAAMVDPSVGKYPVCRFAMGSQIYYFTFHVGVPSGSNLRYTFGSTDVLGSPTRSFMTSVYVEPDDVWRFREIEYDPTSWNIALAGKQNTISDLSTIRSGASAGASALQPSGDGSNLSVTPDGSSTGYDLGNSTTLKSFAQKFKNLVGSLKALAFKDTASYSDLSSGVKSSLDKADTALQAHQTVTNNDPTLAYGTKSTIGSVGSTSLSLTLPSLDSSVSGASTSTTTAPSTKAVYDYGTKYKYLTGTGYCRGIAAKLRWNGSVTNISFLVKVQFIYGSNYPGSTQIITMSGIVSGTMASPTIYMKGFSFSINNPRLTDSCCVGWDIASNGDINLWFSHIPSSTAVSWLPNAKTALVDVRTSDTDQFSVVCSWTVSQTWAPTEGNTFNCIALSKPLAHQSDTDEYGAATTAKYGHTKLTSDIAGNSTSEALAVTPKAVFNYDVRAKTFYNNSTSSAIYWKIATIDIATTSSRLGLIAFVSWRTANFNFTGSGEVRVSLAEDGGRGVVGQFTIDFERVDGTAQPGAIKFYAVSNGDKYELWAKVGAYGVLAINELLCNVNSITYSTTISRTEPGTALPIKFALKSTADTAVGSTSTPVYVNANGSIDTCDTSSMSVGNSTKWNNRSLMIGSLGTSTSTIYIIGA